MSQSQVILRGQSDSSVVQLKVGDLFDEAADVLIIPRSTDGSVEDRILAVLTTRKWPLRSTPTKLGDFEYERLGDSAPPRYLAYATSVDRQVVDLGGISEIGRRIGQFLASVEGARTAAAPLLGAGPGRSRAFEALEAVTHGFLEAAKDGQLTICVLEPETYDRLISRYPSEGNGSLKGAQGGGQSSTDSAHPLQAAREDRSGENLETDESADDLSPPSAWSPIEEVLKLELSGNLRAAVDLARKIVANDAPGHPVDTSYLLFGFIDQGLAVQKSGGGPTTFTLLAEEVSKHQNQYELCRGRSARRAAKRANEKYQGITDGANYLSEHARDVFERALQLQQGITGASGGGNRKQQLSGRHFFPELLPDGDGSVRNSALKRLKEIGLDRDGLMAQFATLMLKQAPPLEAERWRNKFGIAETPLGTQIVEFNADIMPDDKEVLRKDKLGIRRSVNAMASLIASTTLKPPLAIGLFGAWGSGKSFFIRSLRATIKNLAVSPANSQKARASYYWPQIIQVEFNAWHYVDANLWASLVSYVFEELYDRRDHVSDPIAEARKAAIDKLSLASAARAAAEAKIVQARTELKAAEVQLEAKKADIRGSEAALQGAIVQSVWDAVVEKLRPNIAILKASTDYPKLKSHLSDIGLSIDNLSESAEQLHQHFIEMNSLGGRLKAIGLAMLSGHGVTWRHMGGILGAVVLVIGVAVAFTLWSPNLGAVVGILGELAVAASTVAVWARKGSDYINTVMKPMRRLQAQIETKLHEEEEEKAHRVAKLERELKQQREAYAHAERVKDEADRAVKEAEQALERSQTGAMIANFIKSRAESDDYRRHLGIVSMIRDDFGKLSMLVDGHNTMEREALKERPAAKSADKSASETIAVHCPNAPEKKTDLGINRIVLYVDDLDRCPPDRVVEVLQAIHLLLSFPMFVVVVAVDSRWVSHSLVTHYSGLLAGGQNPLPTDHKLAASAGVPAASPRDYLEKIFQIPFWVQPMSASGCAELIDSLVEQDRAVPLPDDKGQPIALPADNQDKASSNAPATPALPDIGPAPAQPVTIDKPDKKSDATDVQPPDEPDPEKLRLYDPEIDAMKKIAPLIGRSPRETKRFVNVYRLLKASRPAEPSTGFVGAKWEFRHAMFLLAVSIGHPRLGTWLFREIDRRQSNQKGDNAHISTILRSNLLPSDFGAHPKALEDFLKANSDWDFTVSNLSPWVPPVAQFCFEPPEAIRAS